LSDLSNKAKAEALFTRADRAEERGDRKSAFKLMLAAAKLGEQGAQLNVANYYADGTGTQRNHSTALYWYRRAYRRGYSPAANNIGILWRNKGRSQRSLYWFRRAVALGNEESNLEIAKHFLNNENAPRKAISYLKRVTASQRITEAGLEEAALLLRESEKRLKIRNHAVRLRRRTSRSN
jgi:TPR repeat protein